MSHFSDLLAVVPAEELRGALIRLTLHAPADAVNAEAIEALHELVRLAEAEVHREQDEEAKRLHERMARALTGADATCQS